jgi:catechol 2,3-dioxygenase-like lactoylglutathione lyase family enzyme
MSKPDVAGNQFCPAQSQRSKLRTNPIVNAVMLLSMAVSVEAQPLIAVHDVRASSRWYATLLAADPLPDHKHRDLYDRVFSSGRLILQLHAWDEEHHPNLVNANAAPVGHGVLLWFQVSDFDSTVNRARELGAEVIEEPHVNPAPRHREIWLRDPDGYVVVIAGPDGEVSS